MIFEEKCMNVKGNEVHRNELGVAQESIFGATWKYKNKTANIKFDEPVFVFFIKSSCVVIVFPKNKKNILFIYDEKGALIKKVQAPIPTNVESNGLAEFMYPQINKKGCLFGFAVTLDGKEYEVDFNLDDMSFGSLRSIRL